MSTVAPLPVPRIYTSKPCLRVLHERGIKGFSMCARCGVGACDRGMPAPAAPAAQQQPEQQVTSA